MISHLANPVLFPQHNIPICIKSVRCVTVIFHHLGKSRDGLTAGAYGTGSADVGVIFTANVMLKTTSFMQFHD